MIGVITEDVEGAASRNDAGLICGYGLQDFLLVAEDGLGIQQFVVAQLGCIVRLGGSVASEVDEPLEFRPPSVVVALGPFHFLDAESVLLLQPLDDCLVVEFYSESLGQLPSYGTATATQFPIDGNDKFLVCVHIILILVELEGGCADEN